MNVPKGVANPFRRRQKWFKSNSNKNNQDGENILLNLSNDTSRYKLLTRNIILINIVIPIIHSALTYLIPSTANFFVVIVFFSIIQILNAYAYLRHNNEIIYLYIFGFNFIGLVLVGEISIFFALTSLFQKYFS